ncbi:MAG TPA: FAD-dependent oxidoreductase [Planctomycetota bacterium]|nr:FAD-dependent oxidoreductase [Planctomycetota bacterium]
MKCPVCGTSAVENGVCFYCEARKARRARVAVGAAATAAATDRPGADHGPHAVMDIPDAKTTSPPPGTSSAPPSPNGDAGDRRPHVLVLGGGLAGLSCAHRLSKQGYRITVVEQYDEVGGLASSGTITTPWGEFDYDTGPHRFHTGEKHLNDEVLELLGDNVVTANRLSRIFLYGRFFNYPLVGSNVVKSLPKSVLLKCGLDYAWIKIKNVFARKPDDNFENWVVNRFGRKLYEIFFGVYTAKTWGIPCTRISADWAAQRISLLSLWDTVKKTFFRPKHENTPRTLVSKFFYPKRGGIGTLCRRYQEELEKKGNRVFVKTKVLSVKVENGRCVGAEVEGPEGRRFIAADSTMSTVSCTDLARMMSPAAPPEVIEAANRLKHRSMVFVYLVLDRPKLTDDHWIYLPEGDITLHRLSEYKNFSPYSAPPDKTLICAEITCDYGDARWNQSDETLRDVTAKDLVKIGLIRKEEILMTFSRRERYAYPLYDLDYKPNKDRVLAYLSSIPGLDTTGRQGLFKYNNMDHSIGMGLAAAENLMGRGDSHRKIADEQTYFG